MEKFKKRYITCPVDGKMAFKSSSGEQEFVCKCCKNTIQVIVQADSIVYKIMSKEQE